MADINVVPYIDVMLVLLVIFMATAPLLTQGIAVELPRVTADPVAQEQLDAPLVITVRRDGSLFVNLGSADEPEAISLPALEQQITRIGSARPDAPVLLRGDARAAYGRVTAVLGALRRAGLVDVGLVTDPPAPEA